MYWLLFHCFGGPGVAKHGSLVFQRVDDAIRWIDHYTVDSVACFVKTYPLDSDLSGG